MSLLTICQSVAVRIGLSKPTQIVGNTSQEIMELLEFAIEEGEDLVKRGDWQQLRTEKTFTTVADETQTNAIPTDFDHFIDETFWNRTATRPLVGALSAQEWQAMKGMNANPFTDQFTYRGSNILVSPAPAAGQTMAYEYISKNYCTDSSGTGQSVWTADSDLAVLPEEIFKRGILVRWKADKGLSYDADLAKYETMVRTSLALNTPRRTLDMSGSMKMKRPSVSVPESNWG